MKKGRGKRKGSSFERDIAKELSLWISKEVRNDIFWRTHSSGSLGTVGGRRLEYGDIMAIDDLGKPLTDNWNIECRCGRCLDTRHLIYPAPKNSSIIQLIEEGMTNARLSWRKSLWIIKEHAKPIMVMCQHKEFQTTSFESVYFPKYDLVIISFDLWKKEFKL